MKTNSAPALSPSKRLRIGLWTAQLLVALVYIPAGSMKLFSPVAQVASQIPWAVDVSELFLRFIGIVDLAAGLGFILPALTRIAPKLTIWAGFGSCALQVCALSFHFSRGEYFVIPMNLLIIALSLFVAWGRSRKAPIAARVATS